MKPRALSRRDCIGVLSAGALLASCGDSRKSADAVTLKLAVSAVSPSSAPLYIAQEGGYFREAGLEIVSETATTVSSFVQMLASGAVDVALPALTPALVNAVPRKANVKVVFARERVSAECGGAGQLVVRTDAFPQGVPNGSVLRGKRIAILNEGGAMDFFLHLILQAAGVRREELEVRSLRPAESLAALQAGQIDGFVSFGLIGDVPGELRNRIAYVHPLAADYPGQQASYVAFGPRLLGPDREIGVRFLRVWWKATRDWVNGKTPRYLETWARESGIDPAMVTSPCRDNLSPDGKLDAASLQRYADWLRRIGVAEAQVDAAAMMDLSFLEEVSA